MARGPDPTNEVISSGSRHTAEIKAKLQLLRKNLPNFIKD